MASTIFGSATTTFVVPSFSTCKNQPANTTTLFPAASTFSQSSDLSSRRRTACINALSAVSDGEASKGPAAMRLSGLYRYPIKATRGESLVTATLGSEGVANDRRYVIANAAGIALTQRDTPALATLEARLSSAGGAGEVMELRAGARTLNLSVATTAPRVSTTLFGAKIELVDQGADASAWLAEILSTGGGGAAAGGVNALLNAFGRPAYRLLRAPGSSVGDGSLRGGAGLADMSPLHLICEESLGALNARRAADGKPPVPMDRFRPNLVVSGCPRPHAEDSWRSVTIGGLTLAVTSPCPRCTVPDVQQTSGRVDMREVGPMKSLRDYRQRPGMGTVFGIYLRPSAAGAVRVGDAVSA